MSSGAVPITESRKGVEAAALPRIYLSSGSGFLADLCCDKGIFVPSAGRSNHLTQACFGRGGREIPVAAAGRSNHFRQERRNRRIIQPRWNIMQSQASSERSDHLGCQRR